MQHHNHNSQPESTVMGIAGQPESICLNRKEFPHQELKRNGMSEKAQRPSKDQDRIGIGFLNATLRDEFFSL